ncbi:deoxyribonuclease IV [bacterium]|nr:deoxyribonuclease IV [bacterium]
MILGAHVSTSGGVSNAPLNARKLGITAFQIFTKNQNRWKQNPTEADEIDQYLKNCEECGIEWTISHDAYLINLCATDEEKLNRSREAFLDEMIRADRLQIPYLVMHPGSHLGAGEEAGLRKIAESLRMLLDRNNNGKVRVLLETTAGQGNNLGYRFEQLAELIRLIDCEERTGVCLDTCHIFTAGYDIRTVDSYRKVMSEFDEIIGLNRLLAFHLNDSKKDFASRVDRHEHIGEGKIGSDAFRFFLNDPRFGDIPGLLETPGMADEYVKNIKLLRELTETDISTDIK